MATFAKLNLSGSTSGRNIKITQTATAGNTLHTAHATDLDEVYLWACNTSTSAVKLTIECGGVTSPDDLMEVTIPAESGWVAIHPGTPFTGAVVVAAWAATTAVINVTGYVNRITA